MKIVNFDDEPINACAIFDYRGYEVSCSTIMRKNRTEIVVFWNDVLMFRTDEVIKAIDWIESIESETRAHSAHEGIRFTKK